MGNLQENLLPHKHDHHSLLSTLRAAPNLEYKYDFFYVFPGKAGLTIVCASLLKYKNRIAALKIQ